MRMNLLPERRRERYAHVRPGLQILEPASARRLRLKQAPPPKLGDRVEGRPEAFQASDAECQASERLRWLAMSAG